MLNNENISHRFFVLTIVRDFIDIKQYNITLRCVQTRKSTTAER